VSKTFEPQLDVATTTGIAFITLLTAAAGVFWWNVIVPQKRTEVSISKSKGEIKGYLDELKEAEGNEEKGFERWLFSDWLNKTPGSAKPGKYCKTTIRDYYYCY
jgi:hypothetical protein